MLWEAEAPEGFEGRSMTTHLLLSAQTYWYVQTDLLYSRAEEPSWEAVRAGRATLAAVAGLLCAHCCRQRLQHRSASVTLKISFPSHQI